jgi:hypothetical protein
MIVRIEDIALELGMAGNVNLGDAFGGDRVEVDVRVETVIFRGDVNVINVEKDAAIGALDDFVEKLPLGHLGGMKLDVAADVFDGDGDANSVANFANIASGPFDSFPSVGHGKEIVGEASIDAAPAEVIAQPGGSGAFDQSLELAEVVAIGAGGVAEVHGDAVLNDPILFEDLVKDVERPATVDHVVFRNDLEPIDARLLLQNMLVMRDAETDADAVFGEGVKTVGGHVGRGMTKDETRGGKSKAKASMLDT